MVNLIVAIGNNNVIGIGNKLPWHYKEDLEYFKQTTLHQKVIMGEQTFKSIIGYLGKPLPNRTSVIATLITYNVYQKKKTSLSLEEKSFMILLLISLIACILHMSTKTLKVMCSFQKSITQNIIKYHLEYQEI